MPSKKYTSRKRAEIKREKIKQQKGSNFPALIVIVIVVITAIGGLYFVFFSGSQTDNNAPILTEDYYVKAKNDAAEIIDVLANDVDPDNDNLSIVSYDPPAHGSIDIILGQMYYAPETDFTGVDIFEYTVSDGTTEKTSKIHIIIPDLYPVALIDTTLGTIVLELYDDKCPMTCANFINLSNDGFYDGMNFYRIKNDFMIQAGRYYPDGSQATSPYGTVNFEATSEILHEDGTISMARGEDINSASAEFFICDGAQRGLDDDYLQEYYDARGYTAFGKTIDGLDVVHTIAEQPHDNSHTAGGGKPYTDIVINSITVKNY